MTTEKEVIEESTVDEQQGIGDATNALGIGKLRRK